MLYIYIDKYCEVFIIEFDEIKCIYIDFFKNSLKV